MYSPLLKIEVRKLRSQGKTYSEIRTALKLSVPKSTLSEWCRNVILPDHYKLKIQKLNQGNFIKLQLTAKKIGEEKREKFFGEIKLNNMDLVRSSGNNKKVKKIVLTILYLAEGSKTARSSLMFGNSDPLIIKMFVNLLRECYKIDESKFRCTLQCRADQNIEELEKFWSSTTNIPLSKFYKARVDKRTIGQVSRKLDYKGVCRIDYFSSAIDLELKYLADLMKEVIK